MSGDVVGAPLAAVQTPALVVDLDALAHNIGVIAEHYRHRRIRLRPHGKNHKSPQILAMQVAAGGTVGGVCAAKVSEAEVFVDAGAGNVLLANQVVDAAKIKRLAAIAGRVETSVAVDHPAQVERLAAGAAEAGAELGVVIEVDTMMRRGGVRRLEAAVALAKQAAAARGLRFRGVMSHQVPTARPPSRAQRFAEGGRCIEQVLAAKAAIESAGLPVEMVSTGETWTYDVAATFDAVTEIEGGSYIVMEVPYAYMTEFRLAARVMGRVVERGERRAVGDVPVDAIGAPNGPPTVEGEAGIVAERIDHHGVVLSVPDGPFPLAIGDPFFLLTHQQDITMNRWERYLGIRAGVVETILDAPARGCVH